MFGLTIEQIFLYLGAFATVLFIIKTVIFTLSGGDFEIDADFNSLSETDISFNFFSVQSILAFFMGFGWMGLTAITKLKTSTTISVVIALAIGVVFMLGTAYLMYIIKKLDKTPRIDLNKCIGTEGKAYTSFEPNGEGQIEIEINKKLTVINATSICNENIDAFTQIKVEKVENKKLYITKI